jgi:hypothetical protein
MKLDEFLISLAIVVLIIGGAFICNYFGWRVDL